jgi:glycosyltransferase involved in cell wall biosynthesis
MTRIWIVNHYAGGPGIGTGWRHWELARRWIGAGGQVRVFTASTSIGGNLNPERRGTRELDGVPFHFIPAPPYGGNSLGRLRNILAFNHGVGRALLRTADTLRERPDVVLASSPQPLVWPTAARVARRLQAAFVPEVRDLWPESLQQLAGLPDWHPLVIWCRRADRMALRSASSVFSPLPGVESAVRSRGHASLRCVTVVNGVSMEAAPPPELDPDLRAWVEQARSAGRRILLYAGAFGVPNAMDQLLDAMELLSPRHRQGLLVLLAGDGSERERLERRSESRSLPMRFVGPRPQPQIRALCRACDAGFLGWLDRPLYRFGIAPQKRGLMLGEGLPLVHAVPHDLVNESALGTGWSTPAGQPAALARTLGEFLETSAATLLAKRDRCRSYAHEHLDWDRVADAAWAELSRLVQQRTHR